MGVWRGNCVRAAAAGLLLSGGMVAGALAVDATPASAATVATLFVAVGAPGDCTSPASPCGSIQTAVTKAQSGPYNGEDVTIQVGSGTYTENPGINSTSLHSLTIAGAGASTTTVNGNHLGTVFADSGTVTLSGLTITGGTASGNGGGIFNAGNLTVTDSTISGNSAPSTATGNGGGIYNNGGTLTVTDSTISGNSAFHGGGAIDNAFGSVAVTDSTISGNTATYVAGGGGGIFSDTGNLTVTSSTISGNTTTGVGGGLWVPIGTASIGASIVAGNTGTAGGNCEVSGTQTSLGYNLTNDATGAACHFTQSTDVTNANPHLGALAYNGGPTETMVPAPGSPAIGVIPQNTSLGSTLVCPRLDQRGVSTTPVASCTIGAVESQSVNLWVAQGGADSGNCQEPLSACATITYALTQATPGSSITVVGTIHDNPSIPASLSPLNIGGLLAAPTVIANQQATVFAVSGTVYISGLTITGGNATGDGGGIFNAGNLTIVDSTISGNNALAANTGGGGGIFNNGGTLMIADSTISGNSANQGGGILNTVGGTVEVSDSTIANNQSAYWNGGGLAAGILNGGTLTVSGSTISENVAAAPHEIGGIYNIGTASIAASIVAVNPGDNCGGSARLTSLGYNLTDDPTGNACGFTQATDITNANPELGSLADNGGFTQTLLPVQISPAISVIPRYTMLGSTEACGRIDQRGVSSYGRCTIGAVEVIPQASTPTITNLPASATVGGGFTASVSTTGDGARSVTSNTPATCTASGLQVTYVGAGTCSLTAQVAGGANYIGASGVAQTFTVSAPAAPATHGYDLVGSDGGVFVFGGGFYGSLPGIGVKVNNIKGIVPTTTDTGYFLVGSDGGVFAFNAPFANSLPGIGVHVNNIVGIVPTLDDQGYFLVGSDGGVFSFNAPFANSLPGIGVHVNNIVGIAATADDQGYWLVGSDGKVYAFGDAHNYGSASAGAVGITVTHDGGGYWVVGANGAVTAFGDAAQFGDLPGLGISVNNIVGIVVSPDSQGYNLFGSDGGVFSFGDAKNQGSLPGLGVHVNNVVGAVPT